MKKSPAPGASAPQTHSTSHYPFYRCTPEHACLFSVNQGIPAAAALEQASVFLDAALGVARDCAVEEIQDRYWTMVYLMDMAKAVVNSVLESQAAEGSEA